MYSRIFYYWYVLLKKTKNGTGVFSATCYASLAVLLHILLVVGVIKSVCHIDLTNSLSCEGMVRLGRYQYLPFLIVVFAICYAYFKIRFFNIQKKFSKYTDGEILCWKNHVFVILVTILPLATIIYIASQC